MNNHRKEQMEIKEGRFEKVFWKVNKVILTIGFIYCAIIWGGIGYAYLLNLID